MPAGRAGDYENRDRDGEAASGGSHTPKAGNKDLDVPPVQMNALMGFVADALTATVLTLALPRDREAATLRAFGRLLWLQNDLIVRHYAA